MQRRFLLLLGALLLCAQTASGTERIFAAVPGASVVGRGVLSYAFWDVYKATLYAPDGQFDPRKPFVLSIEYFLSINGRDIADRSTQEMRKQGFSDERKLSAWNAQMKAIFPDVQDGTVLSAAYIPGKKTIFFSGDMIFFSGDMMIGSIDGDDFGKLFFGIWLDEKTSEPKLRRALLGLS